jgi:hypothetical protein
LMDTSRYRPAIEAGGIFTYASVQPRGRLTGQHRLSCHVGAVVRARHFFARATGWAATAAGDFAYGTGATNK